MSHSAARLDHRWVLVAFTVVHHVASAAWIGGLPYLLMALRRTAGAESVAITARFSKLAMVSVSLLIGAGVALAIAYVGSFSGMLGATYGVMLSAKIVLTGVLLLLGALNFRIVRAVAAGGDPGILPLRRFAETEVGIGFTVLLAAASLTSMPPAIDIQSNQVPLRDIAERLEPRWPRMRTPSFTELAPATPFTNPLQTVSPESYVPGQSRNSNGPADIAWSEYNHNWAGVVVLIAGILAVFARRFRWARGWPLAFLGLALFLLIRADSENWPLGPRGFWESFQVAEVAQHRFFVLLIVAFAVFEWGVQTRRVMPRGAALVFPSVCALGGAVLMTHTHSLGNVKEELLAEWSHIPLAVFAVLAGWSRWLELRLPKNLGRIPAWVWPPCFVFIGLILVLYRES
jgi:putative copper resistance protein D